VSAFGIYYAARELDAQTHKDDSGKLKELDQQIRADMGRLYRLLDAVNARVVELDGPATLPRPSAQTYKQQRIARCPRCGTKEVAA